MIIPVKTSSGGYDIVFERGTLNRAAHFLNLDRRVLIVTDDGVPPIYPQTVARQCKTPTVITLKAGESSKNINSFILILEALSKNGFTRTDCVVAVGGGVMGDLAGFAAACYMRGIDFYNIPTTVLSQVDSSIGGKTAIDFCGYKNSVGAFYPPRCVLIDPDTLKTLEPRQISNGLAEAVKMALTSDSKLFFEIESNNISLEDIIYHSILIKRKVVEADEKESGVRKILNFGHTLAHAIEAQGDLLHGECVAIGMLYMCGGEVRERLKKVLARLKLPMTHNYPVSVFEDALRHDKKASGDKITVVLVPNVGEYQFKTITFDQLSNIIKEGLK